MSTLNNLKKVYRYCRNKKKSLLLESIGSLIGIIVSIALPIIAAKEIVYLTDSVWLELIFMALVILVLELIDAWKTVLIRKNTQQLSTEITANLYKAVGSEVLKLSQFDLDRNSTGTFVQRMSNDSNELADMFTSGVGRIFGIIGSVGTFISVFIINYKVGFYYFICAVVLTILHTVKSKIVKTKDKIRRKTEEKVVGLATELVRGARDIKMLNSKDTFIDVISNRINQRNEEYIDMRNVDIKYNFYIKSLIGILEFCLVVLLIKLIVNNGLSIAMAIALYSYRNSTMVNFMDKVSSLLEEVNKFNLSCERVFSLLEEGEFTKEEFGKRHIDEVKGNFEFKHVKFGYTLDQDVLRDCSFKIKENSTVAFVGPSGAGKTTIFSLLCKMYNVTEGEILIDGIDINELDEDSIRGNITIISQNPYIFNMSIRDNLKVVKADLSETEMKEACRLACLEDFINNLPDGYDTVVGEGGVTLSGGQRQRLAIARAFVQKTKIILFDEATSSLDNETQGKIQEAISNMKKDYTILIIAHRLSTVINSDQIFVLNDGKIVDKGSHEKLLENSRTYRKLYESEFKKRQ